MNDRLNRCFVDSNIWLYAFINNKQDQDKSAIARSMITSKNIVISTQVINEVCNNLIKKAKFPEKQIQELVQDFYQSYQIIDLETEIFIIASKLRQNYYFSYWDSLIVACALAAEVEILYSEDMQNGLIVNNNLKIVNPFQSL